MIFVVVMWSMILKVWFGLMVLRMMFNRLILVVSRILLYGMLVFDIGVVNFGLLLLIVIDCRICLVEYSLVLRFDSVVVSMMRFIMLFVVLILILEKKVMNGLICFL